MQICPILLLELDFHLDVLELLNLIVNHQKKFVLAILVNIHGGEIVVNGMNLNQMDRNVYQKVKEYLHSPYLQKVF